MVKKRQQPYVAARRDVDGAWLCNAVADCDSQAVQQASPETLAPCAGCDVAGGELKANLEQRHVELASIDQREEAIKSAAKARRDEPTFNESLNLLDQVELRAIAERRQLLGSEIEGLTAAHAAVVAEHTHPLFACDKHVSKLPR